MALSLNGENYSFRDFQTEMSEICFTQFKTNWNKTWERIMSSRLDVQMNYT